jgi:phenylalanyl-tRNA synthetase alpha chain
MSDLAALEQRALTELQEGHTEEDLRSWKTRYLGDQGLLKQLLKDITKVPPAERPAYGREANRIKDVLTQACERAFDQLKAQVLARSLSEPPLDVTLPGRRPVVGRLHPATRIMRDICAIFADLGFQVFTSREVEDDEHNFTLLNMPEHHPAREMWDTFHTTTPGVLLRTHTSPGQIHAMKTLGGPAGAKKPIRVILPGMCYRYEQITTRSEIQFQQVEGLAIGKHISMADLKGTIIAFAQRMFGAQRRIRIRASYFPFTEPSIEVDMDCIVCGQQGCSLCKRTGWLEILGAGMVHPVVLKNGGYDPEIWSGFAFGMGPQRIAMLKHAIDDIRLFWANDLRFLQQF